MSVVAQVGQQEPSPLASARLQRKLTVEEAARRAGLTPEQIEWLEAGRVYRFPAADDALVAVVLYATAIGIDQDEARGLARLPVEAQPKRYPRSRIGGLGYKIKRVAKANRFDYPDTAVYFEPGGEGYGARLARQLGVQARPLPGGNNPRRLVVIAG